MFQLSKPIWAKDKEKEINLMLAFKFQIPGNSRKIRLTASTAYHLYVNNEFISYGPARAGDGYFRIDEWDLSDLEETNEVSILVAGYNISCFEYTYFRSFLNCEVLSEEGIVFATGRDRIECREYTCKLRYTDKYSRQRTFTEVYDFSRMSGKELPTAVYPDPNYLERRVPPFSNRILKPVGVIAAMKVTKPELQENVPSPFNKVMQLNPDVKQFPELECCLFSEAKSLTFERRELPECSGMPERSEFRQGNALLYTIEANSTGMIGLNFRVKEACEIYLVFDELLTDGDVVSKRSNCLDAVKITAPAGEYKFMTFEPYTFQYLKVCVTGGSIDLSDLYIREIAAPMIPPTSFKDPRLQLIYDAAVNSYRQNATDIYMDCPSRERAGWLCDSFFMGRSEYILTGKSVVEYNFLENFLKNTGWRANPPAPKEMLPMCYPSSHDVTGSLKNYIPNWAMWFVVELAEYGLLREGDSQLINEMHDLVYDLIGYFRQFENEDGLLEDLPGWVFLEWSRANDADVVCGVNYPTNMLYSGVLESAGKLYKDKDLLKKALKLKETISKQSFNGRFFTDNAVRKDGKLELTENTTEVCQYYAFFFDAATKEKHPELLQTLLKDFGPQRKQTNMHPDVPFANAFIGNYLRLEVLFRNGFYEQLLKEIDGYFYYMAELSGSLWEYDTPKASCCHGFASHTAYWLLNMREEMNL